MVQGLLFESVLESDCKKVPLRIVFDSHTFSWHGMEEFGNNQSSH